MTKISATAAAAASRAASAAAGTAAVDKAFRNLVLDASLADKGGSAEVIHRIVGDHLGIDPMKATQACEQLRWGTVWAVTQAGIDAYLAQPGRRHEVIGVSCPIGDPNLDLTFSKLFVPPSLSWPGVSIGQATWEQRDVGFERTLRCLVSGMILVEDDEAGPAILWVSTNRHGRSVTYVSSDARYTQGIQRQVRQLGSEHTPFKGEMITIAPGTWVFQKRPEQFGPDDVILPPGLLERIDQHAVGIAHGAARMSAAGQHLKRGLLLYGPPGTGKTHTVRYLISQLPSDTTILCLSPRQVWWLEYLLPILGDGVMVLLDDVDAIATDRSLSGVRTELFNLLEALDGVHGRGNVLFVLTTNRLDVMEPAVAARPGRIDEALEVPRPDADCRRRLFARYRQGMDLIITDEQIDEIVHRTDGVTGSFTKEMLRRATVIAVERKAERGPKGVIQVTGADISGALDEMLDPANPATRLLLGADPVHSVRKVAVTSAGAQ